MTNLCRRWFHLDFLKTERWPKSCCNQPACDYGKKKRITELFTDLFLNPSTTITPARSYVHITWAVANITEQSNVSVQLVPQSQTSSHARASSSRMWPRWRQKKKGSVRNKPSFSACTRKALKSWMIADWEQRRNMPSQAFCSST